MVSIVPNHGDGVQATPRRAATTTTYRICVERLVVDEHVCLGVPAWDAWGCATTTPTGAAAPTAPASASSSSSTATAGHCMVDVCLRMLQGGGARRRAVGVVGDGRR